MIYYLVLIPLGIAAVGYLILLAFALLTHLEVWIRSELKARMRVRGDKRFIKNRYIEVIGGYTTWSIDLTLWNVFCIGEFTRENVHDWLADDTCRHNWEDWFVDFHAVCGEQDIPWATKEGCDCYRRTMELAAALQHQKDEPIV